MGGIHHMVDSTGGLLKHIIILVLSFIITSCGSGGSDPNNPNNVHDEISDLGMYVGYAPMKVADRQGLVHDWYMLYTSKVSAGIYLRTEPTNQYPIIEIGRASCRERV